MCTSCWLVSKRVMGPIPDRPSQSAFQVIFVSLPTGVTMPMPVIATRFVIALSIVHLSVGAVYHLNASHLVASTPRLTCIDVHRRASTCIDLHRYASYYARDTLPPVHGMSFLATLDR